MEAITEERDNSCQCKKGSGETKAIKDGLTLACVVALEGRSASGGWRPFFSSKAKPRQSILTTSDFHPSAFSSPSSTRPLGSAERRARWSTP